MLGLFLLQRVQNWLPLVPGFDGCPPRPGPEHRVVVVTNTNWQSYTREPTMFYLTQMVGLATQNFVSAAVGMAVAVALIRGLARSGSGTIGNFWADLVRGTLYVLVPISLVLAVLLVSQGVVQTFDGPVHAQTVEGATQTIPVGPAASQVAIKQLGTNGGGFYNANSRAPVRERQAGLQPPRDRALLLIPFASPLPSAMLVGDRSRGYALVAMMVIAGGRLRPLASRSRRAQPAGDAAPGTAARAGNMEGKEQLGIPRRRRASRAPRPARRPARSTPCTTRTPPFGGGVVLVNMMLSARSRRRRRHGPVRHAAVRRRDRLHRRPHGGPTPEFLGKSIGAHEIKLVSLSP